MIAIGERINGMFEDVKKAIAEKDQGVIQDLARRQTECGAGYLDVNVGTAAADQEGTMQWLVETIQAVCATPLALDSQKINVIEAGLKVCNTEKGVLLNSTPLDKKNDDTILDRYVALAKAHNGSIVALTMDRNGIPQNVDTRVEIAANIVAKAAELDFEPDRIFIDPIVLPVNVPDAQTQPGYILETMSQIRLISDPPPHMTVGLSNMSQGTTYRSLINRTFLVMAIAAGLDSAIVDVFDEDLMNAVATAEMLLNKQIYSDAFLKAYRMLHGGKA